MVGAFEDSPGLRRQLPATDLEAISGHAGPSRSIPGQRGRGGGNLSPKGQEVEIAHPLSNLRSEGW
eukprot:5183075-Pyramimonas_sp.AAC.1